MLGIGPQFFKPVEEHVLIDPKHARETSNLGDDDDPIEEPPLHVHGASTLPPTNMKE